MPVKKATKKKAARTPVKKKAVKKAAKKATVKKPVFKKKAVVKKAATRRKTQPARKAVTRTRKAAPVKKTRTKKAAAPVPARKKTKRVIAKPVQVPAENNLPPVEEKAPVANNNPVIAPGMDNKSLQQAAVRHYDNHHIRLSSKKGGIKPSGKKPLW